jgi:hypothetical protein
VNIRAGAPPSSSSGGGGGGADLVGALDIPAIQYYINDNSCASPFTSSKGKPRVT